MRTVCPSCEAAYDVPASVLAAGRTLRCARCGADFTPSGPAAIPPAAYVPPPVMAAPPASAPVAVERLLPEAAAAPALRARPRAAVLAGWALSLVVLATAGWAFVTWRIPIQRTWPASERIYTALGYHET